MFFSLQFTKLIENTIDFFTQKEFVKDCFLISKFVIGTIY